VAPNIPTRCAKKTLAVQGLYVVPGIVDIHVHVYAGKGTPADGSQSVYAGGDASVYPNCHTFRCGVTTVVDAGCAGHRNFMDFKTRMIDRSPNPYQTTRILAFLNIVGRGMGTNAEQQDTSDMDPEAAAECARRFPEIIVGIKTAHYEAP